MKKRLQILAGSLLVILLTACSEYAVLDSERTPDDALPAVVEGTAIDIEEDSSRLVGAESDRSFWLARSAGKQNVCLVVFESDLAWEAACGKAELTMTSRLGKFLVQPDGQARPDSTRQISENVFEKLG